VVLNPLFVQSVCVFMYVPNDMHVFVGVSCMCLWVFVGVCGCLWVFVGVCGCLWVFVGVCGCLWVFVYILIPPRKNQDLSMFYIEGTGGANVTVCVMHACVVLWVPVFTMETNTTVSDSTISTVIHRFSSEHRS
jgi:hypothetical protein